VCFVWGVFESFVEIMFFFQMNFLVNCLSGNCLLGVQVLQIAILRNWYFCNGLKEFVGVVWVFFRFSLGSSQDLPNRVCKGVCDDEF
jgi:hypothetical protein